jgi:hypothetical protein
MTSVDTSSEAEREGLVEIVRRFMRADLGSEEECDRLVADFEAAVPHPRAFGTDLLA